MLILKERIYKHHKLSLIIATFGIVLILVPVFLEIDKYELTPNILNFVVGVCFPLFFVVIKYGSDKYYRHPLKLSLIFGIIAIFLTCIIFICYSLIKYRNLSYFENLKDFIDFSEAGKSEIVYFILMFATGTIMQVFTLLGLFYFSPTLIMVTDIIHPMLLDVVIAFKEGSSMPNFILYFAGYLIVFFSALIYNEIIVFNCCGLSNDTKKFVLQRADKEIQQIEESFKSDSSLNLDDDS
jgi:drug/metabolite transporter (DMT)-like permease